MLEAQGKVTCTNQSHQCCQNLDCESLSGFNKVAQQIGSAPQLHMM